MAKKPKNRYKNADELLKELKNVQIKIKEKEPAQIKKFFRPRIAVPVISLILFIIGSFTAIELFEAEKPEPAPTTPVVETGPVTASIHSAFKVYIQKNAQKQYEEIAAAIMVSLEKIFYPRHGAKPNKTRP